MRIWTAAMIANKDLPGEIAQKATSLPEPGSYMKMICEYPVKGGVLFKLKLCGTILRCRTGFLQAKKGPVPWDRIVPLWKTLTAKGLQLICSVTWIGGCAPIGSVLEILSGRCPGPSATAGRRES
jgi:hypothetical protein